MLHLGLDWRPTALPRPILPRSVRPLLLLAPLVSPQSVSEHVAYGVDYHQTDLEDDVETARRCLFIGVSSARPYGYGKDGAAGQGRGTAQ